MSAHMTAADHGGQKEGARHTKAGVTGRCELHVGAGN